MILKLNVSAKIEIDFLCLAEKINKLIGLSMLKNKIKALFFTGTNSSETAYSQNGLLTVQVT